MSSDDVSSEIVGSSEEQSCSTNSSKAKLSKHTMDFSDWVIVPESSSGCTSMECLEASVRCLSIECLEAPVGYPNTECLEEVKVSTDDDDEEVKVSTDEEDLTRTIYLYMARLRIEETVREGSSGIGNAPLNEVVIRGDLEILKSFLAVGNVSVFEKITIEFIAETMLKEFTEWRYGEMVNLYTEILELIKSYSTNSICEE